MSRGTSHAEDKEFAELLHREILNGADFTFVLNWVAQTFQPEDVFEIDALENWATDNGFTRE